ncbi:hypothetical protein [Cellulosilyticum sp. I15G10I2]|uniref:hypothetical protein n=1 Tax=Cellulosilyticum sp. I15G10I2 TaxID=1892843 RepID=UPI00085C0228|nr:hypothetical protein [Cellulosilyticum sp. I15G10I2]
MTKRIVKIMAFTTLICVMCSNAFATAPQHVTPTHQAPAVPPATPDAEQHITPTHQAPAVPPATPDAEQHITPAHQAPRPNNGATTAPTTPRPGATPTTPGTTTPTPSTVAPTAPGTATPGSNTRQPRRPNDPSKQSQAQPFVLDNFKVIETTLKSFGVDSRELANYIKQGKKLEDVLKAEKISIRKFKKQVMAEYFKVVDQGVTNKQLTTQQASQLKKAIKETVKSWLPRK